MGYRPVEVRPAVAYTDEAEKASNKHPFFISMVQKHKHATANWTCHSSLLDGQRWQETLGLYTFGTWILSYEPTNGRELEVPRL